MENTVEIQTPEGIINGIVSFSHTGCNKNQTTVAFTYKLKHYCMNFSRKTGMPYANKWLLDMGIRLIIQK